MCRLICILVPGSADGLCGSSDPAVLVCSAVWGLFSFIALIAWLRLQGDHSSASDLPTAELLGLLSHTQTVNERPLSAAAAWGIVDAPVARAPIALPPYLSASNSPSVPTSRRSTRTPPGTPPNGGSDNASSAPRSRRSQDHRRNEFDALNDDELLAALRKRSVR